MLLPCARKYKAGGAATNKGTPLRVREHREKKERRKWPSRPPCPPRSWRGLPASPSISSAADDHGLRRRPNAAGRDPALDPCARVLHRSGHRGPVHLPNHPRPRRRLAGHCGRVHHPGPVPPDPRALPKLAGDEAPSGVHLHLLGASLRAPLRLPGQVRARDHVGDVVELGPVMGRGFAIQHINPPPAAETVLLFAVVEGIRFNT